MGAWRFLWRSLLYHWKANLSVLLGATVGAAVLIGALAVGDCVRYSLKKQAMARIGQTELVYFSPERFFRDELAAKTSLDLKTPIAPAIFLRGTVEGNPEDTNAPSLRVGEAQVIGVESGFWGQTLTPSASPVERTGEGAALNSTLAKRLALKVGDEVTIGVVKPSLLSRDAPLSTIEDSYLTLRLPIKAIVGDEAGGRFSLAANQVPPLSVFVPLETLQKRLGLPGRANLLLVKSRKPSPPTVGEATPALWSHWELTDSGVEVRPVSAKPFTEIRSERIFLEPSFEGKVRASLPESRPVLTYFVNGIQKGDRATPYSTVSALPDSLLKTVIPYPLKDDEIVLSDWLAQDLGAGVGNNITLKFWVMGDGRKLVEKAGSFRVRGIVPLSGTANDPDLMPSIPGLSDKKNCRDWEPGVPVDLDKIRDKDQKYWEQHRGTPKAFITLASGQTLWNNRFGNTTALRFENTDVNTLSTKLKGALNPATLGVAFTPLREQADKAAEGGFNFGTLFIGFSFFLIAASLILTTLLFNFNIERRAGEIGTLLAVGVPAGKIRNLLSYEGSLIALVAAFLGAGLGLIYTRIVIRALTGVWSGAVGSAALEYHVENSTIGYGIYLAFEVAAVVLWLAALRQARQPVSRLLSGQIGLTKPPKSAKKILPGLLTAFFGLAGGIVLTLVGLKQSATEGAETFFIAGSALLIGCLGVSRLLIEAGAKRSKSGSLTLFSLALRGISRRMGRSLAAVILLASGAFMVIAVGANQKRTGASEARQRDSGTGGFAYFARTTLPVYIDLNSSATQQELGLDAAQLKGVSFVPFRTKPGDDASCLNLNRAQAPTLLGVNPTSLASRNAFGLGQSHGNSTKTPAQGWDLLNIPQSDGTLPAIADSNTVTWALGKKLGDVISYADEKGETFRIKIVAIMGNSVLQGALILSERDFLLKFPSHTGYQTFLIDTPAPSIALTGSLSDALKESGLDIVSTSDRLDAFGAVENTYLLIFMALGGLGLLLGSVGLGVVTLRNMLERRSELALLRAVGFPTASIQRLIFTEHALLLLLGVGAGTLSAVVAVFPAIQQKTLSSTLPFLTVLTLAVGVNGAVWVWIAASLALRSAPVSSLREE